MTAAKAAVEQMKLAHRTSRCAEVIGEVTPGATVHAISAGEWSAHDMIVHLLGHAAPAELWAASWAVSDSALHALIKAREAGQLTTIQMLLDWRVTVRNPKAVQLAKSTADRIRVSSCHAKLYVLRGARSYTISTSANLTNNPRLENYVISESREIADFHVRWLNAELRGGKPFEKEKSILDLIAAGADPMLAPIDLEESDRKDRENRKRVENQW
ncbi:MAG: hypothetical protein HY791_10375 [Deltaproteobacteria bacterium]|nr:hypothetical protein [Deltaproteobacteria bacterium]